MEMVMVTAHTSRGCLVWRSGEQLRVVVGDRHDSPGAMHKAVDAVEAAILRIPKLQPQAALADADFLRNIAVSKRQRLGKPNAIPVRKFACTKHNVRSAAGATVERVPMVSRAEPVWQGVV